MSPSSVVRRLLAPAGSALLLALAAAPVSAQVDFQVSSVEVNQAIQTGASPLFAGGSTFVRSTVRMVNGPPGPVFVDSLCRVFVDGIEADFSPLFSENGPIQVIQPPVMSDINHTLNFSFIAPASNNVTVTVEVNPLGDNHVVEANPANNTNTKGPLNFELQSVPELQYSPIDYRPSGGPTPNLPDPNLIKPGIGDGFVQGIFPTSDWDYRRTDAPSKLYTSSLSGTGSGLLNALNADINLMVPQPNFLYGWVPGPLPGYNGQAFISGKVSMGNTEPIRFQRTFAHELGHNFGLSHNNTQVNLLGVDVEHHLVDTQGLAKIKPTNMQDIMSAGLLTNQAWVATPSYTFFFNHFAFNDADTALSGDEPVLLVSGIWNTQTGALRTDHLLTIPAGTPTEPVTQGADMLIRAFRGDVLVRELPAVAASSTDACTDSDAPFAASPEVAFSVLLPVGEGISRVSIVQAGSRPLGGLELRASSAAPQVAFSAPAGTLTSTLVHVVWEGSDPDGDALSYYLRYSPDGVRRVPLASGISGTSFDVDLRNVPAPVEGRGFFELLASDGLNTTVTRSTPMHGSNTLFGAGGNAPWVHVLSPNNGSSHWKGATVLLHSSGWDLEDRELTGSDIQWTSSLDGNIGSGRVTAVADLSVGVHLITATGTDSGAQQTADSVTVTVLDRGLPDVGTGETCQTDLGFGGPGTASLSLCGGNLSGGTNADLLLTGAAPSSTAWLVLSAVNDPTPVFGGTLVPVPVLIATPYVTNGSGEVSIANVPGGGGPITFYIQFAIEDGGQALGWDFSNGLEVVFGL